MSRHLGRNVSAFVDGQLDLGRTETANAHLISCADCRDLVDAERSARRAIGGLGSHGHGEGLAQRLVTIPQMAEMAQMEQASESTTSSRRGVRSLVVAGVVASLGAFAISLFVLGGQYRPGYAPGDILASNTSLQLSAPIAPFDATPSVDDEVSSALIGWVRAGDWIGPDDLPPRMVAASAHLLTVSESGERILQLELVRGNNRITMLEQRAQLDPHALAALEPETIQDYEVYRINGHWLIMQCDDWVIAVSSGIDDSDARAVIGSLPPCSSVIQLESPGITDRFMRGWQALTELT